VATIFIRCSSCDQGMSIGDDRAGRKIKCVKCGESLLVPPTATNKSLFDTEEYKPDTADGAGPAKPTRHPAEPKRPPHRLREEDVIDRHKEDKSVSRRLRRAQPPRKDDADEDRDHNKTGTPPPGASHVDGERQRRKRISRKKAKGGRVRFGLLLLLVAMGTGIALNVVSMFVFRLMASPSSFMTFVHVNTIVALGVSALQIAGYAFCLSAPEKQNARKLALAALVLACLTAMAEVASYVELRRELGTLTDPDIYDPEKIAEQIKSGEAEKMLERISEQTERLQRWLSHITLLAALSQILRYAQMIVVPLLFRSLAAVAKANATAENCLKLLYLSAGVAATGIVMHIMLQLAFRGHVSLLLYVASPIGWIMGLLGLGYTVLTILVVLDLRNAIGDEIGRKGSAFGS
jgi:hypothetical protein